MRVKIFTIKRSEVENNLSPLYFQSLYQLKENIVKKAKYPTEKIKHSLKITRGRFGHRPRNDPLYYGGQYPFVQTGDVVQANINGLEIKYTQTLNELGLSTSRMFKAPQLLFTIAANIGYTGILNFDSCFPDSIVALESLNNDTSIEYLNVYFTLIQKHIDALAPTTAQKNLNNEQLAEIPIVIPPKDIQRNIVDLYNSALSQKQQKQQQAKNLLDGVDTYLLSELGITLPKKDKSLSKRIFTTKFSEVSGGRFDPSANIPELKKLRVDLCNSVFSFLKEIITESKKIVTEIKDSDIYIGLENIESNTGNYIETDVKESISSALSFKKGQILFPKLRPYLNKVFLAEFDGICSTEFHIFNAKSIDTEFLYYCLLSKLILSQTENLMTGNTLPRLQSSDIYNLIIPLPPLHKQKEIAEHIRNIRTQTKQLQAEAEQIMQDAKQQVEKMILR